MNHDFKITFDPEISEEQAAAALSALADCYCACGDLEFLAETAEEE